ncbi:hypothetical protein Hanom_Chr08g00697581 [Helianthus anomalus]
MAVVVMGLNHANHHGLRRERCTTRTISNVTVAKLDPNDAGRGGGGSKTYISKNFYRTVGSKMYILKNFYMKTTYITLPSEKFEGSGAPSRPFYTSPLQRDNL